MERERNDGRINVRWDVIVTVVAWLVGGLLAYGSLDGRIRVLEAQMQGVAIDLKEIKGDLKLIVRELGAQPGR